MFPFLFAASPLTYSPETRRVVELRRGRQASKRAPLSQPRRVIDARGRVVIFAIEYISSIYRTRHVDPFAVCNFYHVDNQTRILAISRRGEKRRGGKKARKREKKKKRIPPIIPFDVFNVVRTNWTERGGVSRSRKRNRPRVTFSRLKKKTKQKTGRAVAVMAVRGFSRERERDREH